MRMLIFLLASIALFGALLFLIGWLLPKTREGHAETVINATPQQVLDVVANLEAQPEWREIGTVTRTQTGWVETTARGERIEFVAKDMTTSQINLSFVSDAGYFGEWQAVLRPVADGTHIKVVERATVPSPLGRVISRLMFNPTQFAQTYLANLKTRTEEK